MPAKTDHIPALERHCGSWVVSRKDTGAVVGEFYDRRIVERFNPDKVTVETALKYLCRINAEFAKSHAKWLK